MRLIELDPRWVGAGGEGVSDAAGNPVPERKGIGVSFECPCGCRNRGFVPFTNPMDGGPAVHAQAWHRVGETFETLTLTPSIQRVPFAPGQCSWHGFITNGQVLTC